MLEFNSRYHVWKNNLIFFFCNFLIDFTFVWEVPYERSRSTKVAAQFLKNCERDLSNILGERFNMCLVFQVVGRSH